MKSPAAKISLVAGGYLMAVIVAAAAVILRVAFTSDPNAQASSGMYAFGDCLLFAGVFSAAALLPTAAGLYFLRPYPAFWMVFSWLCLTVAVTSLAAAAIYQCGRQAAEPSTLSTLASLSMLRVLMAPPLAIAFLLSALLGPSRNPRLVLLVATAMETLVSAYAGFVWIVPLLFNAP
jgi:hypothetical protein